jgi:hypothetical protein
MEMFRNITHFAIMMLPYAASDIIQEVPEFNTTSSDNILMASLWSLGVCSCGSIMALCKYKKDELPYEIYKNVDNKLELYVKDNGVLRENLEKLQSDINELKKIIDKKKKEKDLDLLEDHKIKHKIEDEIDEDIEYQFGKGPIRYKIDDKYYHGVGVNETQKWNKDNNLNKCFFQYIKNRNLINKVWDTHDANNFCNSCIIDEELSKRRKVSKIYRCLGHVIKE